MNFVIGFLGGIAVVALLSVGGLCGWTAHKTFIKHTAPVAEKPGDVERRRLMEEQQAFRELQNYSMERAYGLIQDDAQRLRGTGGEPT